MKAENYNNFPKGFPDPLKNFTKPTVFKYLNVREVPDPDNPSSPKRLLMPGSVDVGLTDTISYEYKNEEGELVKEDIHIAYAIGESADGELVFSRTDLVFKIQNAGQLLLDPKIPKHRRMFKYLYLCSENRDSPYRNPAVRPTYYMVNPEAEAKEEIAGFDLVTEAMSKIKELNVAPAKELYSAIFERNPESLSENQVKAKLHQTALKDPTRILKSINAGVNAVIYNMKQCVEHKILRHDVPKKTFVFEDSKEPLFTYTGVSPAPYQQLAEYVRNNPSVERTLDIKLAATKMK